MNSEGYPVRRLRGWMMFLLSLMITGSMMMVSGCNRSGQTGKVQISGRFGSYPDHMVHLEELRINDIILTDSTRTDGEGNFHADMDVHDAGFYLIRVNREQYIPLQLQRGETVEVTAPGKELRSRYTIRGSPGSVLLNILEGWAHRFESISDSLTRLFMDARYETGFLARKTELDSLYYAALDRYRDSVRRFITRHPGSLSSLLAINKKAGQHLLCDEEKDTALFFMVDSALMSRFPENPHTRDHHERVASMKERLLERKKAAERLATGAPAPPVSLPDTSGTQIPLSSLQGKWVLLYFWAGWNAQSRQDHIVMKQIYARFKTRNLEVYGVSLDEHPVVWKGAIRLDGLPWTEVSDLLGFASPVASLYFLVDKLPAYFLLDPEGQITARSERIEEIHEMLKNLPII